MMQYEGLKYKLAYIYNKLTLRVVIDKEIIDRWGAENATITLVHKSKFRNKLRRVSFTTASNSEPVVNGVPGRLTLVSAEEESIFTAEIPAKLQDFTWEGSWDIYFSYGPYDSSDFTVKICGYIKFVEPCVNLEYTNSVGIYLSLIDGEICIGRIFRLDISELNGDDLLGG